MIATVLSCLPICRSLIDKPLRFGYLASSQTGTFFMKFVLLIYGLLLSNSTHPVFIKNLERHSISYTILRYVNDSNLSPM